MRQMVYWFPPVVWMGLIFFFSSRERVQVSDIFTVQFVIFKLLHIIEYGILYAFLYRAFKNTQNHPRWKHRFHAFLLAFLYAMTDEIHQVFIPTREGRIRDVVIDTIGIFLALVYIWKYLPKGPKTLKNWARVLRIIS